MRLWLALLVLPSIACSGGAPICPAALGEPPREGEDSGGIYTGGSGSGFGYMGPGTGSGTSSAGGTGVGTGIGISSGPGTGITTSGAGTGAFRLRWKSSAAGDSGTVTTGAPDAGVILGSGSGGIEGC